MPVEPVEEPKKLNTAAAMIATGKDLREDRHEKIPKMCEKHVHTNGFIHSRIYKSEIRGCLPPYNFDMDDGFLESSLLPYAKELLIPVQGEFKIFKEPIVVEAFCLAEKAHRGQVRLNGDPKIQQCLKTAMQLAPIVADPKVIAAGLLHDTIDDSNMCYDCILEKFGPGVAELVGQVSKLRNMSRRARQNNTARKSDEAVQLHTLILCAVDPIAILIKLAERLNDMETLYALPSPKQHRIAEETLAIFVPLANRLGRSAWKVLLEDLCFRVLNPRKYNEILSKRNYSFDLDSAKKRLEQALEKAIPCPVLYRRKKSVYSTYRKMQTKNLSMDKIPDIFGIRVTVDCENDCYKALGVVRQLWPDEVKENFNDYIDQPLANGYQSLHVVVLCEEKIKLEVQIRTKKMHSEVEFGMNDAAYWRYKEPGYDHCRCVLRMVKWARFVINRDLQGMSRDRSSICYADSIELDNTCPSYSDDCPLMLL